MNKVTDTRS